MNCLHSIPVIMDVDKWESEEQETHKFALGGSKPVAKKAEKEDAKPAAKGNGEDDDDDDDVMIIDQADATSTKKRSRSDIDSVDHAKKKKKLSAEDEIIVIE